MKVSLTGAVEAAKEKLAEATGADVFAPNRAWEVDRELMLRQSERRAWTVALAATSFACLAIATDFVRGALRQIVPIPILVDRTTGEASVQMPLSGSTVPVSDALDKHFVVQFVTAREEYDWSWLNRDYNTVARMAATEVFAPYAAQFDAGKGQAITDRLADRTQWRIAIVGVRFSPLGEVPATSGGAPVRFREAFVTFDRQIFAVRERSAVGPAQRFVASLRFEYRPRLAMSDAERIENPLGFVVTAYRTDAEFVGAGDQGRSSPDGTLVAGEGASSGAGRGQP